MATVRFTKTELRDQQKKLIQLEKYLPTLQLKKALLQMEINQVQQKLITVQKEKGEKDKELVPLKKMLEEKIDCNPEKFTQVIHVNKHYENIAGVESPIFESVIFNQDDYLFFDTPAWTDSVIQKRKEAISLHEHLQVLEEKKRALQYELREVSIRVNLFEKVLIPRSKDTIKKIRLFLGEQELAAVAQAKVAKKKIELKKVS